MSLPLSSRFCLAFSRNLRPGAAFLFAVDTPTAGWAAFAENLLRWSLENLGAGGKTNAGYGRFESLPVDSAAATATAAQASPAPRVVLVEGQDIWVNVVVRRNPGSGELTAYSADGKRVARAAGGQAAALMEGLPEEAQAALKGKRREIGARVTVETIGNQIRIVRIEPQE